MWRSEAGANADFLVTRETVIEEWERQHGRIPPHAWVLIRTDWSQRKGAAEVPQRQARMAPHTPGFHPQARAVSREGA